MPKCWIIAGPNGAGKTTFALEYLPQVASCQNFINADLIAAGLSPLAPEKEILAASRLFLKEIKAYSKGKEDFAFETTLSGRGYLRLVKQLQKNGWEVELIYLALPSVELSLRRVAERVKHGGHNIPKRDILRRFPKSLRNLLLEYSYLVDNTHCYMNSIGVPELIFHQKKQKRQVIHTEYFSVLQKGALL